MDCDCGAGESNFVKLGAIITGTLFKRSLINDLYLGESNQSISLLANERENSKGKWGELDMHSNFKVYEKVTM